MACGTRGGGAWAAWRLGVAVLAIAGAPTVLAGKPGGGGGGGDPGATNHAIAYIQNGKVYRVKADGSGAATFAANESFCLAWSAPRANGPARFAYLVQTEPGKIWRDLWVIDEDGASASRRKVASWPDNTTTPWPAGTTPMPEGDGGLHWMPDGERIVFTTISNAYVMDVRTGQGYEILDVAGNHLAKRWHAHSGSGQIIAATPSADLDPVTPGYQGWLAYAAAHRFQTPDGANAASSIDLWAVRLVEDAAGILHFEAPWDVADATRLVMDASSEWQPTWVGNGRAIAFQHATASGNRVGVVGFDPVAGAFAPPASVTSFEVPYLIGGRYSGTQIAASPDGAWLAVSHGVGGTHPINLARVRPNGTGLLDIVKNKGFTDAVYPAWNPRWTNDVGP